jgi:cobalt-zinc-cadmium efflux system outer membrane protein
MRRRCLPGLFAAAVLFAGCLYPVREKVDGVVCELATLPRDLQPLTHADVTPPAAPPEGQEKAGKLEEAVKQASGQKPDKKAEPDKKETPDKGERPSLRSRLEIPEDLLPGGRVPLIELPKGEEARRQAIERLLPPLPPIGEDLPALVIPGGAPLCLADLQRLAVANSPLVKQAAARVEEMRGQAIQAGLPPNPNVGYEGDTSGTTGGAGYQGAYVEQRIITAGKLQLARAVAAMDLKNAELDLYNTQTSLATRVRSGYFAVLVAQESLRLNRALVKFTTDVYQIQVEQVKRGGFAALYEPMYLRALATQARAALVQARNRRTAAWKELAATMGLPGMPPVQLAGRLDIPIPVFDYKSVLAKVLANHTDIKTAENSLVQAQYQLELAKVTPIPDVNVRVLVQKDRTGPPFQVSPSVAVSVPVPVWDKNQGNILTAQGAVERTGEGAHRARSDLTNRLADAFERYENGRVLLAYYRDQILPDLVRVYRQLIRRYDIEAAVPPGVAPVSSPPGFTDLVVAQQNLAAAVATYITTLGGLWQAVVDVADPLQTLDLFAVLGPRQDVAEIPDLEKLPPLPCGHPCSPIPHGHQKVIDGCWPPADPTGLDQPAPPAILPAPREEKAEPKKEKKEVSLPPGVDPLLLEPPPFAEPRTK